MCPPKLKVHLLPTFTTLLYASGAFAAASGVCAVARRHSSEVHVRVAQVINSTASVMMSARAESGRAVGPDVLRV